MAGEVREALKGAKDAPGVVKLRVPGKTAGKLRAAAGLLALVLGVSLVLGSLGQTAGRLAGGADSSSFGPGWRSADWQETPAFRREMAQRLQAFLSMATGSDLDWWGTASGTPIFCPGAATLGTPGDLRTPPRRISPPRTVPRRTQTMRRIRICSIRSSAGK